MAVSLTHEGRVELLASIANYRFGYYQIVLHKGSALSDSSGYADLVEANFSGYSRQYLMQDTATLAMDYHATQFVNEVTFTHNGGGTSNTVTAWAVISIDTNKMVYYENLASSKTFSASGDNLKVSFTHTLTKE